MPGLNLVTQLIHPGLPNPRVVVPPQALDPCRAIFGLPAPPAVRRGSDPHCWPSDRENKEHLFLFSFDDGRLAYVQGPEVRVRDRDLFDEDLTYSKLARAILADGAPVPGGACTACSDGDLGEPWSCTRCDGSSLGIDLSEWFYSQVFAHNNCYSYAWRRRWCSDGTAGSQPGDIHVKSLADILEGLKIDGLMQVQKSDLRPGGRFIAFFSDGAAGYHFARVDGSYWTHMFGGKLPSSCDATGAPIPLLGLERAVIPDFTLHSYYEAPAGAVLCHCF